MFVINNPSYFQTNTSLHGIETRQKNKLHKPLYTLSSIQKGIIYTATNVYNKLPFCITQLQHNELQFRNALKKYLPMHTFFTVEQFLSQ
jgi:sialic acid synthase SpsE